MKFNRVLIIFDFDSVLVYFLHIEKLIKAFERHQRLKCSVSISFAAMKQM